MASFRYNLIKFDEDPRNAIMSTTLIPILKKFIYILRKATESFRFKSLTKSGLNLISDHAYFSSLHQTKKTKVFIKIFFFKYFFFFFFFFFFFNRSVDLMGLG